MRLFTFRICLLVAVLACSGVCHAKPISFSADTVSKSKIQFTHRIELGANFRVGDENVFTLNDFDNTTEKNHTFLIGKYTQHFVLRFSHAIVFKKEHEAGICYGADLFFQRGYTNALMPLFIYWAWQANLKTKVKPFVMQRVGYAFYFRNRQQQPLISYEGVEGGAAAETIGGVVFSTKKKVMPQLAVGYRFQHLRSQSVYHTDASLSQSYGLYANLPSKITEVSNGIYHFIYLSVGVKF